MLIAAQAPTPDWPTILTQAAKEPCVIELEPGKVYNLTNEIHLPPSTVLRGNMATLSGIYPLTLAHSCVVQNLLHIGPGQGKGTVGVQFEKGSGYQILENVMVLAHSIGMSLPRMALNFCVAALVVFPFVRRVETSLYGVLGFLILAGFALLLDAMIAVLIGLAAFFVEEVRPIHWIYSKLLMSVGGMFLPLDMFPEWLRRVSNWLPFRLIIYAPARTFVAFDSGFLLRA